jgi:hypothetical protein
MQQSVNFFLPLETVSHHAIGVRAVKSFLARRGAQIVSGACG